MTIPEEVAREWRASIVRRIRARKLRTCRNGGACWAVICRCANRRLRRPRRRRTKLSKSSRRDRKSRILRPRWRASPDDEAHEASGIRQAHRSDRSGRSAHLRHGGDDPDVTESMPRAGSFTSLTMPTYSCTTRSPRTARYSKRGLRKRVRWRSLPPPERLTPTTGST